MLISISMVDDFGSAMANISNSSAEAVGLDMYESDSELATVVLFQDYQGPLLKFAWASCILFMLIGIPGNLITIIALARSKKVRNATAIFIINLSCADLLFCCFILPLAASTFWSRSWPHGKILCHMFPYARYMLVAVSLFSVQAITFNRYIMISHPRLYPKLYKKKYISMMIAGIWLFAFGALIPTCLEKWGRFSLDPITGSCTIIPDEQNRSPKKFLFITGFALPSLAIILCYARILWIVKKTAKQSRSQIPRTEMRSVPKSMSVERSLDIDQRRSPKERSQFRFNCFINPGAELSSSYDSSTPEEPEIKCGSPEVKTRKLGNETAKNFRQSFIATIRWTTATRQPRLPTKKDKKLLTMIVAIMVSFCVCHLPITLTKTIFQEYTSHPVANIAGYVLIYLTTCINPIIYVVMSSEYRKAYKNLMKCSR